ncbi:MAG: HDOD domain-containing protein [Planctomycetota bacterium]
MPDWSRTLIDILGAECRSVLPPEVELPVMPKAALEFAEKSRDENTSAKQLGDIIETDAVLTAELLKQVNSAAIGLRRKCASAGQAIALLGPRNTRLFVLTVGLKQAAQKHDSKLFNLKQFWATNYERAIFAREVASLLNADAELAYAAAMLQDFLLPTLANEMTDRYIELLARQAKSEDQRLDELERATFGWDHAFAAATLMRVWNFPDDLVVCVAMHHLGRAVLDDAEFGRTAAAAVALAGLVPDATRQSPVGLDTLVELDASWEPFDLAQVATAVAEKHAEVNSYANHIPLARRVDRALAPA